MLAFAEAAPLSRSEIARRTGLDRSTITKLATGERGSRPSHDTVQRIAKLCDGLHPPVTIVNK